MISRQLGRLGQLFIPRRRIALSPISPLPQLYDVDISGDGVYNYLLFKVHWMIKKRLFKINDSKYVLRGYLDCPKHSDIRERLVAELNCLQENCIIDEYCFDILGGGRIDKCPDNKTILVYGYSSQYGKADHKITVAMLRDEFCDYLVTCSEHGRRK